MIGTRRFFWMAAMVTATACRVGPPKFDDVVGEYVYVTLSFQPSLATEAGYQRHAGVALGELLDDVSQASLGRQRQFYQGFEKGFARFQRDRLAPEDQIDYDLIRGRIARDLAALDEFHSRPERYTAILERALRVPLEKEYAPRKLRAFHLTRRLEMMPPFVEHARRNLREARGAKPDFTAIRGLIERANGAITPEIRPKFELARDKALEAIREFENVVQTLPPGSATVAADPPDQPMAAPPGSSLARRVLRAGLRPPDGAR